MIVFFHLANSELFQPVHSLAIIRNQFGFGVPLFYALSAFVLMHGYGHRFGDRAQLMFFYGRRFWRIAPLFYVMMVIQGTYFGISDPLRYLTSLTFTFNLIPQHVTGFVRASWSIGIEMLFYAIFPLVALTIKSLRAALFGFAAALLIQAMWHIAFAGAPNGPLSAFGNFFILGHIAEFMAGVAVFYVFQKCDKSNAAVRIAILIASLVALATMILRSNAIFMYVGRPIHGTMLTITLSTFVLAMALCSAHRMARGLINRGTIAVGNASFSVYLWHPLIILALNRTGIYRRIHAALGLEHSSWAFLACVAATLIILIPLSLLSFQMIELRGSRLARQAVAPLRPRM